MKVLSILVLTAIFAASANSQGNSELLAQYKQEVANQAGAYPVTIAENNILINGYVEGNIHTLEIQVTHRLQSDINGPERERISKQLHSTLGVLYCNEGTPESIPRTIGISIRYQYFDKELDPFLSIVFSPENCAQKALENAPQKSIESVRLEMQIRALNKAGTGHVKVCDIEPYGGKIVISYSNENGKAAILSAFDEYFVNSITISLDNVKLPTFRQFLIDAEDKAKSNATLEHLNLSSFDAMLGKVSLTSHKGNLKGSFRSKTGVDSVYLSIDTARIVTCLDEVKPYL